VSGSEARQWGKRDGYAGPGSFDAEATSVYGLEKSAALAGRRFTLNLADGRVVEYFFRDHQTLDMEVTDPTRAEGAAAEEVPAASQTLAAQAVPYIAVEAAPGIFYCHHDIPTRPLWSIAVVLDLNRDQCILTSGEIPAEGEREFRVRRRHVGGCLGIPRTSAAVLGPPFPPDLVGKRFVADYGERYAWELIYLNDHLVAWQGIKGNPGIGDVEDYSAAQLAPGIYTVSWSEKAEALYVSFLYNFNARTITGHMFGYVPEERRVLSVPMVGRIRDSADYGLATSAPGSAAGSATQRNMDVVLRQHYEVWNQAKLELVDEIYAEDFSSEFVGNVHRTGRDAAREFVIAHRRSFPDWTEKVVDIFAHGDRVVSRYVSTGTHLGEFEGIPPTGRRVVVNEVSVYRVLQGRIVNQWGFPDVMSLLRQLTSSGTG
jgi:steroid delta-isomerase-like uncharacterized protein